MAVYAEYWPVALVVGSALTVAVATVVLSSLLTPKRPNPVKQEAYECGIPPLGPARIQFPVKFYLIALLFLLFDIETVFVLAWAVTLRDWRVAAVEANQPWLVGFPLIEMTVFIGILLVGLAYAWRKGALKWN